MGSSLGTLFANIFLTFPQRSWLADCPLHFKSLSHKWYVDNCFHFFKSSTQVLSFFSYLSSSHPNIQFTHELDENFSPPFLDIHITHQSDHYSISVFHKPTSPGLFTNFNSLFPMIYKRGLILLTLISRYFKNISSFYNIFQSGHQKLKNIFFSQRIF